MFMFPDATRSIAQSSFFCRRQCLKRNHHPDPVWRSLSGPEIQEEKRLNPPFQFGTSPLNPPFPSSAGESEHDRVFVCALSRKRGLEFNFPHACRMPCGVSSDGQIPLHDERPRQRLPVVAGWPMSSSPGAHSYREIMVDGCVLAVCAEKITYVLSLRFGPSRPNVRWR